MENNTINNRQNRMRKTITVIIVISAICLAITAFLYWYLTRQTFTKTSPFGVRIEKQQEIVNALGTVDYYVYYGDNTDYKPDQKWLQKKMQTFREWWTGTGSSKSLSLHEYYEDWKGKGNGNGETKGNGDKSFSAIFSYRYEAGFDFKNHKVNQTSSNTLSIHCPEILHVNKSEHPIYFIDNNSGVKFEDTKSYEVAIEKLAWDFAKRSQIIEQSRASFVDYLSSINSPMTYIVEDDGQASELIKFTYSPIEIAYYPDLLEGDYSFNVDTTRFSNSEFTVYDNYYGKDVYRISFVSEWKEKWDDTIEFMQNYYLKEVEPSRYLRVVDPDYPESKLVFYTDNLAHIFIDGKYYKGTPLCAIDMVYENNVKPDMIYLLNQVRSCKDTGKLESYFNWKQKISDCWSDINDGRYEKVKQSLKSVPRVMAGVPSHAENCILSYVAMLDDESDIPFTGDSKIDEYIDLYRSINSETFTFNEDSRERFLILAQDDLELSGDLRKLFIKDGIVGENEKAQYAKFFLQEGYFDPQTFSSLESAKMMADYFGAIVRSSIRQNVKNCFSESQSELLKYLQKAVCDELQLDIVDKGKYSIVSDNLQSKEIVAKESKKIEKIIEGLDKGKGDKYIVWVNPKNDEIVVFSSDGVTGYTDYDALFFTGKQDFVEYASLDDKQIDEFATMCSGKSSMDAKMTSGYVLGRMKYGYTIESKEELCKSIKERIKFIIKDMAYLRTME